MVFFYSDFVIINRRFAHEMYFYPQYAFRKLFTWCTVSGRGPDHVQREIFCGEGFCTGRTVTFAPDGSFF